MATTFKQTTLNLQAGDKVLDNPASEYQYLTILGLEPGTTKSKIAVTYQFDTGAIVTMEYGRNVRWNVLESE